MIATLVFIAGFSLGMGAVAWIVLAEIVPSRIRAQAFSIFTAVNWGSNLFIGLFTLTAIDAMGQWLLPGSSGSTSGGGGGEAPSVKDQQKAGVAGLYAVFAVMCAGAVAFIFAFVGETMGKSLEELEGRLGNEEGGGAIGGGGPAECAREGGAGDALSDEATQALLGSAPSAEDGLQGDSGHAIL